MGRRVNSGLCTGVSGQMSAENYELQGKLEKQSKMIKMNLQLFASNFKVPKGDNYIELNVEKQQRHIGKTAPNKSRLCISIDEARQLIKDNYGRGTMVNNYQEVIDFGKVIGHVEVNGKMIPTTLGKIHYSKTGSHLVPYRDLRKVK